ncbi:MAG: hypothetical protein ACI835_005268 [Planctomycetota bacterium]
MGELEREGQLASYQALGSTVSSSSGDLAVLGSNDVNVIEPAASIGTPRCFCASAPCGNADTAAGYANSTGTRADLDAERGNKDELVSLHVFGAPTFQFGLFFRGDNSIQLSFGHGQLFTGQNQIRSSSAQTLTSFDSCAGFGPCLDCPTIPSITGVAPDPGVSKHYPFLYRDPQGPCSSGFNTRARWRATSTYRLKHRAAEQCCTTSTMMA